MRSVQRLGRIIDESGGRTEALERALAAEDGEPALSANLCDALLHMRPVGRGATLSLFCAWARTYPLLHDADVPPSEVHLRAEHFDAIERISLTLRGGSQRPPRFEVGTIEGVYIVLRGSEAGYEVDARGLPVDMGAWYFEPCEYVLDVPFSRSYLTAAQAERAAHDFAEGESAERRRAPVRYVHGSLAEDHVPERMSC